MHNKDVKIPKTAIIGASGFLGKAFLDSRRQVYPDCIGTVKGASDPSRNLFSLNLLKPDMKSLGLSKSGHKEALILAAVTKIDKCEKEKKVTRMVNVDGTLEIIRQLTSEGIKPIFFSSDYIFDGKDGSYTDKSPANPITEYGRQKAEVEAKINAITHGNFLVVRLSKIFSVAKGDGTLLDEMANALASGGTVYTAFDQIFCPILISDVIKSVDWLQAKGSTGIVNVCSSENWSRYDLAVDLARSMGVSTDKVIKISLDDIMIKPKGPKNTSMLPTSALNSCVPATSISSCVEQVAANWTGRAQITEKRITIFGKSSNIGSTLLELFGREYKKLTSFSSRDCNFLNREQCIKFFKNLGAEPQSIIFLATVNKLLRNDYQSFLDNVAIVKNFIEAQSYVNTKHIIYFSSVDVYGMSPALPVTEETKVNPDSWYGLAKYCSEWMLEHSPNIKCPVTILRFPGVYGSLHNDRSAIGKIISDVKEKKRATIHGSGSVLRDYVHAQDVADIVKWFIKKPYPGTLNVATGSSKAVSEIVNVIRTAASYKFDIVHESSMLEREFDFKFDISKLKRIFPELKFTDLESGISSYLNDLR